MPFISGFIPPSEKSEKDLWFLLKGQRILVKDVGEEVRIPRSSDLESLDLELGDSIFLGSLNGDHCYAAEASSISELPDPYMFFGLRALFISGRLEDDLVFVSGLSNQWVQWYKSNRYCGQCGNPTTDQTEERAKICPKCGQIQYPRLSPAIIVAILKDHQILLAHAQRFPVKFYSVLAGFVEPGESLEDCVRREVKEEVGLSLKNIQYFGSQPWPFPDSLMVGFTAEWAGGEINVDPKEILDAAWFSADNLPAIPPKLSIARQLIDWFVMTQSRP